MQAIVYEGTGPGTPLCVGSSWRVLVLPTGSQASASVCWYARGWCVCACVCVVVVVGVGVACAPAPPPPSKHAAPAPDVTLPPALVMIVDSTRYGIGITLIELALSDESSPLATRQASFALGSPCLAAASRACFSNSCFLFEAPCRYNASRSGFTMYML